ncbi:unnamed protein product [Cuscuta epithymum]|uniref:Uncharacterized protein n=1 Tax=Cuscuta epithymum TaxID=186058 RepID=A0AAV0FVK0_9ASTE|nr:unnamed protein product [Cuscuta epithymum]
MKENDTFISNEHPNLWLFPLFQILSLQYARILSYIHSKENNKWASSFRSTSNIRKSKNILYIISESKEILLCWVGVYCSCHLITFHSCLSVLKIYKLYIYIYR